MLVCFKSQCCVDLAKLFFKQVASEQARVACAEFCAFVLGELDILFCSQNILGVSVSSLSCIVEYYTILYYTMWLLLACLHTCQLQN